LFFSIGLVTTKINFGLLLFKVLSCTSSKQILIYRNYGTRTFNHCVIEYAPKLETAFRKGQKQSVITSWQMDETYLQVKAKGEDVYLYRAVDKLDQKN